MDARGNNTIVDAVEPIVGPENYRAYAEKITPQIRVDGFGWNSTRLFVAPDMITLGVIQRLGLGLDAVAPQGESIRFKGHEIKLSNDTGGELPMWVMRVHFSPKVPGQREAALEVARAAGDLMDQALGPLQRPGRGPRI